MSKKISIWNNLKVSYLGLIFIRCVNLRDPFMDLSKPPGVRIYVLTKLSKDLTLSRTKIKHVFIRRFVGIKSLSLSYMWMIFYS